MTVLSPMAWTPQGELPEDHRRGSLAPPRGSGDGEIVAKDAGEVVSERPARHHRDRTRIS